MSVSRPFKGSGGANRRRLGMVYYRPKALTAKMRVQAKRIQCNNTLRIKHEAASSGKQQRDLLIHGAIDDNMKPIYCIYCTEEQRRIWKQASEAVMIEGFQAGCLLADASDVLLTTRKLEEIEDKCIPWHYLFSRYAFVHGTDSYS